MGVPPRLVGYWLIRQLRRYGVVESRFCFEGGSRCGRGEGLYVLVSDQSEDIARAFQMAAEGKLANRRRPIARNSSAVESPRRTLHSRAETRMSDVSCLESLMMHSEQLAASDMCCGCSHPNEESIIWPSTETRSDSCDYGDANSVADYPESHLQESCRGDVMMGRCTSCISKLGVLSRSSTATNTPGTGTTFTPAWTMDTETLAGSYNEENNVCCCNNVQPAVESMSRLSDCWSSSGSSSSTVAVTERCCAPVRPPKPLQLSSQSPIKKKPKPPMPLPVCSCPHHQPVNSVSPTRNPYDNYDIPKTLPASQSKKDEGSLIDTPHLISARPTADDYYDTPKNLKDSLVGDYGNYDTPPPPALAMRKVTPCLHHNIINIKMEHEEPVRPLVCPCHRVTCWAENRPQKHFEISSPILQRVKHGGDVKVPHAAVQMPIYATVDKSKKTKCRLFHHGDNDQLETENKNANDVKENLDSNTAGGCNYANIEVIDPKELPQRYMPESNTTFDSQNYENLEFAQSLEHYENSKELLLKAGITQDEIEKMLKAESVNNATKCVDKNGVKFCTKCGHACNQAANQKPVSKQDDYLMMEPTSKQNSSNKGFGGKHFSGYLPMHPVPNPGCLHKQDMLRMRLQKEIGDKSSSTPSLNASISEACRKRLESDIQRIPGSAMLGINHSVSAANSPYLRRRVIGCLSDSRSSSNTLCNSIQRKRSNSADSKYLDDLESVTERTVSTGSPTQIRNSLSSKNTSIDSISSHSVQLNNSKTELGEKVGHNQNDLERNNVCESSNEDKTNESKSNSLKLSQGKRDDNDSDLAVNVRRSSSVPCKSGHNRDSSSSNDSGVSITSLKHRGADFVEFELPLTTSMSSRRHYYAVQKTTTMHYTDCYHSSLPRRSKSVDPMRELTFQFQQIDIPLKSSSAEAEIPICLGKRDSKGITSPGSAMPYIDSRSTSSGTSDMSDYIETLSLSSYSSSDTPDCLQLGRPAATTLRPRSGREYHKIDRYILESDEQSSPYTSITSVAEKSESPSPGYVSSSPGQ